MLKNGLIDPPLRVIVLVAGVDVQKPPEHPGALFIDRAGMLSPAGRTVVRLTPVAGSGLADGFVIVKVRVDVPFTGMVVGL